MVVFPNSVVFQPSANFFKQAPGTSFTWNELRLVLAPDCDYRLAEKRLMQVVEQVFDRYRETVRHEYRVMERRLNLGIESPKPHSLLRLNPAGIEMVIRYPAEARRAVQVADEVSRRLLEAIQHEPSLRLVTLGTPDIQASGAVAAGDEPAQAKSEASSRP